MTTLVFVHGACVRDAAWMLVSTGLVLFMVGIVFLLLFMTVVVMSLVYFERRVGSKGAWGAQAKLDIGDGDKRETVGAVGKLYLRGPEIQLLGELDL